MVIREADAKKSGITINKAPAHKTKPTATTVDLINPTQKKEAPSVSPLMLKKKAESATSKRIEPSA